MLRMSLSTSRNPEPRPVEGQVLLGPAAINVRMRYGVILPGGLAGAQVEQAVLAERAGWDAVFVWEAAYGVDAWSLLAAMAMRDQPGPGWGPC